MTNNSKKCSRNEKNMENNILIFSSLVWIIMKRISWKTMFWRIQKKIHSRLNTRPGYNKVSEHRNARTRIRQIVWDSARGSDVAKSKKTLPNRVSDSTVDVYDIGYYIDTYYVQRGVVKNKVFSWFHWTISLAPRATPTQGKAAIHYHTSNNHNS